MEARNNHNELMDALNALSVTLEEINSKLADWPELKKKVIESIKSHAVMIGNKLKANLNEVKADLTAKVDDDDNKKIESQEAHSRWKILSME